MKGLLDPDPEFCWIYNISISRKEQLSIGVRFADVQDSEIIIREEFLGFSEILEFDAETIAAHIISKCQEFELDLNKMIGQGYDGCATMAGKINGVQTIISKKFKNATFCSLC